MNIGPTELILILVIALIVFGPKRLPEIGRTIGKTMREFRRASQEIRDEFQVSFEDEPPRSTPSPVPPRPSEARKAGDPSSEGTSGQGAEEAAEAGGPERSP